MQIQPDYAKAHYNLGVVYASQEQYGRAAASYQAALRLDPENPRLLYNLGVVYNRLGRHREAIAAYQRRLRLLTDDAEDADTRFNLGMSQLLLGEREAARRQYQRLKTLDPKLAKQLLQRF